MEKDPRHYIEEIRENVAKLQAQGVVTPSDNALFHMLDGMAGLLLATMENVVDLKRRVATLEGQRDLSEGGGQL
jgi:hypothetical protein